MQPLLIFFYTGYQFLGTYEKTTENECVTTEFSSSQGIIKGEVFEGYECPEGYHQEFADFKDVPKFNLCCVKD